MAETGAQAPPGGEQEPSTVPPMNPEPNPNPEASSAATPTALTIDDVPQEYRALIGKDERARRKAAEAEAEKLKKELDQIRQAEMSELEKREARIKELETERETALRQRRSDLVAVGAALLPSKLHRAVEALIPDDTPLEDVAAKAREIVEKDPDFARFLEPATPGTIQPGAPTGSPKPMTVTESQLNDPKFFRENYELCMKAGRGEDGYRIVPG